VLVNVADPVASSTIVWFGPPFKVKVTVAFGVPVNVTDAVCPEQIVWLAAIVAVGTGRIAMVTAPAAGAEQDGVPDAATLTKV
jgi:hypothetical protein